MNGDLWTYPDSVGRLDLTGFDAEAVDGEIGTVEGTSLEAGAGYLVIDTGRWIFGRKVLIPAALVERVDRDEETVYIGRTKDEIEHAPEFHEDGSKDAAYRDRVGAYYGAALEPSVKQEEEEA
jgi:hypothetical protein